LTNFDANFGGGIPTASANNDDENHLNGDLNLEKL